jgi:CMP-N-acetylneuraminic acid synthetase
MDLLITLCGRGGSKGIPGKNIRPMNGKPLIAYSIEHARKFAEQFPADIALSTDSGQIKEAAAFYGIQTDYIRPAELANDTAGKISVIRHLVNFEQERRQKLYDFVLDLDLTSPLRTIDDLLKGFELIRKDENAYNLFSVNPASRNPYFSMVEKAGNGYYSLVKKLSAPIKSRQTAPQAYDMNGSFYFYRKSFFESNAESAVTERSLVYVMPHICFDLDHPVDFEFMEFLLRENKLDFTL